MLIVSIDDVGSPDDNPRGNAFNGDVKGVQLSMVDDPNDSDQLLKPEDAVCAALDRQQAPAAPV
ncbi:MAG TPA: hypothetical protein VHC19_23775, partial [Pirellulales bacterium]|nr:hypothetical protein [Pirellulales bacterium]